MVICAGGTSAPPDMVPLQGKVVSTSLMALTWGGALHLAIPSGACGGGYATAGMEFADSISGGQGLPALPLTFTLKQPSAASSRWTHARITAHNLAATNLTVTANFYSKGFALILR